MSNINIVLVDGRCRGEHQGVIVISGTINIIRFDGEFDIGVTRSLDVWPNQVLFQIAIDE